MDLLSAADVAARFKWSKGKLYRLIRDGRFPRGRDVGGAQAWTESDLKAYLLLAGRWQPQEIDAPKEKGGEE